MYVEFPVVNKCCCCIPLRYGLFVVGYLKLAILAFTSYVVFSALLYKGYRGPIPIALICFCGLLILIDVIHVLFVVSIHKRSHKLMRVFYIYFLVETVLGAIYIGTLFVMDVSRWFPMVFKDHKEYGLLFLSQYVALFFVQMVAQFYTIILIRSELKKLKSKDLNMRFVNNEEECRVAMVNSGIEVSEPIEKLDEPTVV